MHGTLQPQTRNPGLRADLDGRFDMRVLWAALVPLVLLLRPYGGLIQDARIYIGAALAERDPLGIGRDPMFSAGGQTEFTLLKPVIRALLGVMTPTQISLVLALVGILVWLGAVVVLCRTLAGGRIGWAAAVCVLALPPDYGAYGTFVYGETVLTPRVFAEAAVIGAMAGLLGGRRLVSILLLALALALHPLMALPGIAIAATMLAWEDRRWLLPIGAGIAAVLAAAALKLPVAERLFQPMDAAWLAILRARSVNLFPSLWDAAAFGRAACRVAALVLAASVAPPRLRALMLAVLSVAAGGLAVAALFGDRFTFVLVAQLQTWRALWPLALLGNASVALAAIGLWRRGPTARLTLAILTLAWCSVSTPVLAIGLSAAAIVLRLADLRGGLTSVSPRIGRIALALALGAAALDTVFAGLATVAYLRSAWVQGGDPVFSALLLPGVQTWPLVIGALALAIRSTGEGPASASRASRTGLRTIPKASEWLGLAAVCGIVCAVWNSGTSERRMIDVAENQAADLRRLIGPSPGSILWIDDFNQDWFLARRPAYFNSTQGCPILFSRPLAVAWHARGEMLLAQGLARQENLTPWAASDDDKDMSVSRASIEAICHVPDHPVAIVAPGRHLDAAPPGSAAGVWVPPAPIQFPTDGEAGLHWHRIDSFTVIRCGGADAEQPPT